MRKGLLVPAEAVKISDMAKEGEDDVGEVGGNEVKVRWLLHDVVIGGLEQGPVLFR